MTLLTAEDIDYREREPDLNKRLLDYRFDLEDLENSELPSNYTQDKAQSQLFGWVKAGMLLERVRRCRLYRDKFKDWQDYCERAIGKSKSQISRLINAAKIVMVLAETGFSILPSCISQAERLKRYFDPARLFPNQSTLCEKWQQVISRLPAHSINANSIDEELGHMKSKKSKISIDRDLNEKLDRLVIEHDEPTTKAKVLDEIMDEYENGKDPLFGFPESFKKRVIAIAEREGLSIYETVEKYFGENLPPEENEDDNELDDNEIGTVTEYQMARWEQDLKNLVAEHDKDLRRFSFWVKLFLLKKDDKPIQPESKPELNYQYI